MSYRPLLQPHQQFLDDQGYPLANGKVYTYAAGTTTPQATYKDANGTLNTNPIILDGGGYANIWLGDAAYKLVVQDANGVTLWTVDNIDGINTTITGQDVNIVAPNGPTGYDVNITSGSGVAGSGGDVVIRTGSGSAPNEGGNIDLFPAAGGAVGIGGKVNLTEAKTYGANVPVFTGLRQVVSGATADATVPAAIVQNQKAGFYRITAYAIVKRAATTSSTLPKVTIQWTDRENGAAQTLDITPSDNGNTLQTYKTGTALINSVDSTTAAITYTTTGYASSGATSMEYSLYLEVEQINIW